MALPRGATGLSAVFDWIVVFPEHTHLLFLKVFRDMVNVLSTIRICIQFSETTYHRTFFKQNHKF